jgi:hypothetical protein
MRAIYRCVLCHKKCPRDLYCLNCQRRVCFTCRCNCWVKPKDVEHFMKQSIKRARFIDTLKKKS